MSKEPNRNVYVGHRYVPKIMGEWVKSIDYEGLSIVTYKGNSYTSKKRVPVGIDILNEEFWVVTGNYNAQVEYYREETERVAEDLLLKSDQTYVDTELGKKANKSYVDTELGKKSDQTYVDTELGKKSDQTYVDTELGKKSDKSYVDTELGKKSDKTYVDNEFSSINTDVKKINDKLDNTFISLEQFNAVIDGVTDDTNALQNALEYADGRKIVLPNRKIKINGDIEYNGKVYLTGSGSESIIDLSDGGSINFKSDIEKIAGLSANIVKGQNNLSFNSNHNLKYGDVVIAHDPRDFSWSSYRQYYNDGCMFEIGDVTSSIKAKFFGVAPDDYQSNIVQTYKLTGSNIKLNDFTVIPNPEKNRQINIDGYKYVDIGDISILNGGAYTGIEVHRCYNVTFKQTKAQITKGDAYPLTISNSQKVIINTGSTTSERHSIALGGRNGIGTVPTRDVIIEDSLIFNNSTSGAGASDIHGNCTNIKYSNCIINAHANMAGKDVEYVNCTIYGRDTEKFPDGSAVFGNEIKGGYYNFRNCNFITSGDNIAFGLIHLTVPNIEEDLYININDCFIDNVKQTNTNQKMLALVLPAVDETMDHNINVNINGLESVKSYQSFVFFSGLGNIKNGSKVKINNVSHDNTTNFVLFSNADNIDKTKIKLPKQSGIIPINLVQGDLVTTSEHELFKVRYPGKPLALITIESRHNSISGILDRSDQYGVRGKIRSLSETGFERDEEVFIHWQSEYDTLY